ncbi:portal protein [Gordonia phage DalanDe]|nr:portal protein [Gordonia phage DalanDe]
MAGRFFGSLFETKAKANPAEATIRAGGRALATAGMPLGAAAGSWDMEKAVRDGYERVGMVYRCVDAIAQAQSRLPMSRVKVDHRRGRDDFEVVEDEGIWRLLNFRANSYETAAQFRYRLSATLLLSRRGAFVELAPGEDGNGEIHLLAPGQVQPIPDPKTFVSGYQIMRGDSVIDEIEPERVMWIKIKPHPMDPYQQMTPLVSAGLAVETDFLARMFNRNFLMNDGRPGMLISVRGQLGERDAEELKARYSGGYSTAGQTSVIEADGIDVADMAVNSRDMQWAEMVAGNKQDIQLAFGVPESVMGNASGRTFDNADAERENYYIDTVMPHCDSIAQGLDRMTGDDNDSEVIAFDYSNVDVLQRMANRRREEKRTEFDKGLITVDEYREAAALPPFNVAGTRVLYGKSNVIGIPQNDADQMGLDKLKLVGGGAGPMDPGAASQQGALMGARAGVAEGQRQLANNQAAVAVRARALEMFTKAGLEAPIEQKSIEKARDRKPVSKDRKSRERRQRRDKPSSRNISGGVLRDRVHHPAQNLGRKDDPHADHPYMGLRYKTEGVLEGLLTQWDMRQEDVVAERLHHVKFRKGTRHWLEEKKLPAKQKCKYCDEQATKRIIHSEGRAYIPVCSKHVATGKNQAARSIPGKGSDKRNVDAVRDVGSEKKSIEGELLFEVKDIGTDDYLRYVPLEVKKIVPKYAVSEEEWINEIARSIGTFLRKTMLREARNAAKNMKNDKVDKYTGLDLSGRNPLNSLYGGEAKVEAALDPLYGEVLDIVRKSAKGQVIRLQKRIDRLDSEGATMKEIEGEVRKVIGARAPWRKQLAVAVTTAAVEGARDMVYKQAPNIYVKQWNSQHDPRVRPSHVHADNQQREPHKPFKVGKALLQFPCDPSGPPEEVINCRCYTTQELSDEYWDMVEAAFDAGDDDA